MFDYHVDYLSPNIQIKNNRDYSTLKLHLCSHWASSRLTKQIKSVHCPQQWFSTEKQEGKNTKNLNVYYKILMILWGIYLEFRWEAEMSHEIFMWTLNTRKICCIDSSTAPILNGTQSLFQLKHVSFHRYLIHIDLFKMQYLSFVLHQRVM